MLLKEIGGYGGVIRFCDSDVGCVEYDSLNRSELLSYFLSGHLDEIICVYDGSEAGNFVGIITYYSLLVALSIDGAIFKEYVILDQDVWRNARNIFMKRRRNVRGIIPLPVLNTSYQLICFAYQDEDANREIRMLRELNETRGALQFSDVFPEFKCVKIHEFNELAYFFAEYLRDQNIQVKVDGELWPEFFTEEECQVPEYECLNIYAEGTWVKTQNWKENLLRSVSVEFECVDKIYEANIKNDLIKNVSEGGCHELLKRLRGEKEVILCGIDMRAQDAYDYLLGNGIEACCFVVGELNVKCMHRLFGKEILGLNEAICTYQSPIFIDCTSKYSAWGIGNVDYYDYIGYKRNESYIVLRDYIEVQGSNLLNALRNTEVALTGDNYLCGRLYEYLIRKQIPIVGYLRTMQEDIQLRNMPEVSEDNINKDAVCLIVVPSYYSYADNRRIGEEERRQHIECLREKGIDNYTDYFSGIVPFINIEKDNSVKYKWKCMMPKRVVLGSIMPYSGTVFFRSLLDSHPLILMIALGDLNSHLFWTCVRLSMESTENILSLLSKLIEEDGRSLVDPAAFMKKMRQLLACDSRFTSQELFIMIHIAYMYMIGRDITGNNMSDMIIYWEPHHMDRDKLEECVKWLGTEELPCDIINVVRNSIPQKGSPLKDLWTIKNGAKAAYSMVLRNIFTDTKKYEHSERVVIKFEDLKCTPREILKDICDRWGIAWSDTLIQTTQNGQEAVYFDIMQRVKGFDMRPVYNTYENFFSEFDRFKLVLIDAPWRKKYGYPYVEPDQFARRELQEMFLREFRFEKPGDTTGFYKDQLELDDRIELQVNLRGRIQETRCLLSILKV